ncbi:DUF3826 domain-containing protein [Saccharicrinis sp. FJH2]|uniref:DUF3826 domain-containing protein n=1 Tax=Saccharicrinis sp. FJH65 TaxID=3344659 RepID=UPI0035F34378
MKSTRLRVIFFMGLFLILGLSTKGQTEKKMTDQEKKATEWVQSLELNDKAKEDRVIKVVADHLTAIRTWHNEHPFSTVPAGVNPRTGDKLTDQDRQMIADSAQPSSYHEDLMNGLRKDLTEEQVEAILDKYTVGKVAFTMKGYRAIVPDLTDEEAAKLLSYLKEAREMAVDYKNMKEISAVFEIYKTKCEQYLISNGRDWRALYKAFVKRIREEKKKQQ